VETQKITLALRKEILRKLKAIAAKEGISVSGLLTNTLEELVAREEEHRAARRRNLRALDSANDLGIKGKRTWTRDELHER